MFFEKRVYQGSSGKVYPLPVIDRIFDEKVDKTYRAVWLENDYLRVMLLPELGGRVQRAYDKTNGYDFVYYNEVVKPALVGLAGPWISGGIEFNWPQHHRPSTFMPTDYLLSQNADGSKSVLISEVDRMYGTKGMARFTLYPDRAVLEIRGQLYNRTPLPQTFLWWANPAVSVNGDTQSIFPPDVNAVMDHGKRAVSRFPIATGTYYKHDYGEGVDISRYKNIPVPTSYMAFRSDATFVGGYDYGREAGVLHVANPHISPGKKQWTWGCGDFGQAWDRNLTDENGPYIELMTGVYTDNQPDFSWLKPYEEKAFTQVFLPYKKLGSVKNASADLVLSLDVEGSSARIGAYATKVYERATVRLTDGEATLFSWRGRLSPVDVLVETADVGSRAEHALKLAVLDESGAELLSYRPQKPEIQKLPQPAQPAPAPADVATVEELLLTGLHLEQYRHATYDPVPYYLEGLKRDPSESRLNNAYGLLLLRRGQFERAEAHFRRAVGRLTFRNPNPYDGEPHCNLGLALAFRRRYREAFRAFYKATWTSAQQETAFYELASIAAREGRDEEALELAGRALVKNAHNIKARGLKAVLLRRLGRDAAAWLEENIALDPFDYVSRLLRDEFEPGEETRSLMRGEPATFLYVARDFAWWGCYREAVAALELCGAPDPLVHYYLAAYKKEMGEDPMPPLRAAALCSPLYCFPNALEDIAVLEWAMEANPGDARAPYYLGNLLYDRRRYGEALSLWERSAALDGGFSTVWRNLALAYFNKAGRPEDALRALTRAHELAPEDARILLELDQLHRRAGWTPGQRFDFLDARRGVALSRDDLATEFVTLLNLLDRPREAYELAMSRRFHPWEGGEGRITAQYALSLKQLAGDDAREGRLAEAEEKLRRALSFPHHLGEGKLEGRKDNNLYYDLGCVCERMGRPEEAEECFRRATLGDDVPAGMMYYNDQPADRILYQGLAFEKLGQAAEAKKRCHRLIDYAEAHLFDDVRIDYFAVSLPDLQIFDDDLNARNRAHCHYLMALGHFGLGNAEKSRDAFDAALEIDSAHLGAHIHRKLLAQA
ncbi:MAG: DUF5107 domain-containing protein [Clostridiales bacterium]|nr:DUF5107 domain-containing protein [Clostridiales bacterium]